MAAIVALEALKEHCDVVLSTDSQYVRQGITQWIHNWKNAAGRLPIRNRSRTSISGNGLMPPWASTRLSGSGLKGTPVIRKTNAVTNWRVRQPLTLRMRTRAISLNPDQGFLYCRVAPTVWRIGVFDLLCFMGLSVRGMVRLRATINCMQPKAGKCVLNKTPPAVPGQHLKAAVAEHFEVKQ